MKGLSNWMMLIMTLSLLTVAVVAASGIRHQPEVKTPPRPHFAPPRAVEITYIDGEYSEVMVLPKDHNPSSSLSTKVRVVGLIKEMAPQYGVDVKLALDLAGWESQFDPDAKNPLSSATGIYQFLSGTWERLCYGNRTDPLDNTRCFLELWSSGKTSHWTADPKIKEKLQSQGYLEL